MNSIDKIFQDKLKDFEKSPSSKVWEKLNAGLEDKEEKKKGFFWYSVAAGVVLFIIASLFIVHLTPKETVSERIKPLENLEKKTLMADAKPFVKETPPKIEKVDNPKGKTRSFKKKNLIISTDQIDNSKIEPLALKEIKSIDSLSEDIAKDHHKKEPISFTENEGLDSYPALAISVVIKRGNSSLAASKEPTEKKSLKNSKIARVYTQVLNIKNGEKVNVDEFSNLLAFNKKGKTTQNK